MKRFLTVATIAVFATTSLALGESHNSKPADRRDHRGMMQGGMMRGGMMSMMGDMMQRDGASMMDHCAEMMRHMSTGSAQPNEQWRKK